MANIGGPPGTTGGEGEVVNVLLKSLTSSIIILNYTTCVSVSSGVILVSYADFLVLNYFF